jgi:hypothetical protein
MTVAACLIVNNEAGVIARCLDSLRGLVQAVVIVDTGSTDDTLAVIRGLNYPFPVQLHQRPWKDFAHNRTELLRLAAPVADYLLLLGADWTVEGHLPRLTADGYTLLVRSADVESPRLLLLRSALPWRFEGAVYEYLACEQATAPLHLETLTVRDHGDGGGRSAGDRLARREADAAVLETELARNPNHARNVFYLARCYDELAAARPDDPRAGDWRQKAQDRYRQRSQMGGYPDEIFHALLRLGVLRLAEGDGLTLLLEAWQRCPNRWEPVHEAVRWLNQRGLYQASYALSKQALAHPGVPLGLLVRRAVFDHLLLFEHSISAYWVGRYQESWDDCQTLLEQELPHEVEECVRRNMEFARQRLDEQTHPVLPDEHAPADGGQEAAVISPVLPETAAQPDEALIPLPLVAAVAAAEQALPAVAQPGDPLFQLLRPGRLTAVVAVGGRPATGDACYQPMLDKGLCTLVGFEPRPDELAALNEHKGPLETYLPYLVGDGGRRTLYRCRAPGMTGLLRPDPRSLALFQQLADGGKVVAEEEVATHALDAITEITALDFLQLDGRGAELAILRAGRQRLAGAVGVQTRVAFVPLYEDQPLFADLDRELRSWGFLPHAFAHIQRGVIAPFVVNDNPSQGLNQLLDAALVYVRDFTRPDDLTDEQLKHLALIAHHCYGSFDLALRCLNILEQRGRLEADVQKRYVQLVAADFLKASSLGTLGGASIFSLALNLDEPAPADTARFFPARQERRKVP